MHTKQPMCMICMIPPRDDIWKGSRHWTSGESLKHCQSWQTLTSSCESLEKSWFIDPAAVPTAKRLRGPKAITPDTGVCLMKDILSDGCKACVLRFIFAAQFLRFVIDSGHQRTHEYPRFVPSTDP